MANNNFREHVTATLIDQIQAGSAPWQKPWEAGQFRVPAFNPANGKPFRGINQLWLEAQGHTDPRWVTFRQVQANGYQVRKGEKGTRIECWQWYDREPMKNDAGGPILDDTGKQRYREVRLQRPKLFHAVVFNGSQIDGLELFVRQEPDFNPIERAKQALEQLHVPVVNEVRFSGLYQPTKDEIRMPPIASFDGLSKYYATALQEGAHATGHYSRLARNMGPVGSEDYARETLRTAVAGYMLNTELGLGNYPEQDSSYAGRWISVIKDDPNALFQAARDAEVAKTWIMEPDKRPALIPSAVRGQSMSQVQAKGQSVPMEPAEAQRAERQALVNNMFVNHPHAHPTLWAMDLQESLVLGGSRENKEQLSAAEIREGLLASDLSNDNLRRYLGQTAEAANWRSFASIVPGYDEEHHEFAQIAEQFGKIDWVAEYAASRERREKGIAHRDETLAALGGQAASPLHRELLSALWDLDGPGNKPYAQRPEWYVAGDQRQDDVLKLLSKPLETNVQAPELSMAVFRSEEPAELVVPVPNLKYRDVQSKWMVHASRMAGFAEPEAQEMGMAASAFNGIDAWTHYIDNQDDRREIVQRNKATEKELEALAGRSAKHAELLSVLVDTHEPQAGELFIDTDKWYVPAEKRTNAIAKEIGINPAEYIAEKLMAANQKARAEQNARPLEVAEIRKSWLEVAAREAGISYPSFSAYQQKEYSETDWYKEGATEAAAFYIRDSVDNQSLAHRELASVLWDTYAPRKVDRPAFYISAESRKNDFLRALGSDPEKALLLKAAQQRPNQIDLKEIFKPLVEISEKEIKANWLHQVAQSEGMADANELREAYHKFHGVDAWTHYIDNQDTRREIVERNKATEKELEALAGRSVKHAELLSVLVDSRERQAGEFFIDTSKWYVPADLRKHEVVKSLGKDPEGSLLGLVAKSHEEKKVMPGKTLERDPENKRIFLTVPFSENKEAKALGAKWDRRDKVWFVNEGADMKPFAKWQKKVETARKENPEDLARKEFAEACEENGLVLKGLPEMDGNWHRVAVDGDAKGKTSGSYRGFLEGIPAGQIMNFKTASDPLDRRKGRCRRA